MTDIHEPKERYAADTLLKTFTQSKFAVFLMVAVAFHLVLATATSASYILDYLNPERVKRRDAAASAQQEKTTEAVAQKSGAPGTAPVPPTNASVPAIPSSASPRAASTNTADNTAAQLEQKKDTPIVKEIIETAKPGEIPQKPDELGISIEDTNPR